MQTRAYTPVLSRQARPLCDQTSDYHEPTRRSVSCVEDYTRGSAILQQCQRKLSQSPLACSWIDRYIAPSWLPFVNGLATEHLEEQRTIQAEGIWLFRMSSPANPPSPFPGACFAIQVGNITVSHWLAGGPNPSGKVHPAFLVATYSSGDKMCSEVKG